MFGSPAKDSKDILSVRETTRTKFCSYKRLVKDGSGDLPRATVLEINWPKKKSGLESL